MIGRPLREPRTLRFLESACFAIEVLLEALLRIATESVAYCYVKCSKEAPMSQPMPRIAPLQPPYPPEIQAQFDRIMRGAPPLVLFRVMAGHTRAWDKFRAGGLLDPGPLSLRQREIVIDRTCALNRCEYEWGVHVASFCRAGKTHRG